VKSAHALSLPIFSINDDEHYLNLTTLLNNNSIKTIAYIDINKDFISFPS